MTGRSQVVGRLSSHILFESISFFRRNLPSLIEPITLEGQFHQNKQMDFATSAPSVAQLQAIIGPHAVDLYRFDDEKWVVIRWLFQAVANHHRLKFITIEPCPTWLIWIAFAFNLFLEFLQLIDWMKVDPPMDLIVVIALFTEWPWARLMTDLVASNRVCIWTKLVSHARPKRRCEITRLASTMTQQRLQNQTLAWLMPLTAVHHFWRELANFISIWSTHSPIDCGGFD